MENLENLEELGELNTAGMKYGVNGIPFLNLDKKRSPELLTPVPVSFWHLDDAKC